MYSRSTPRLDEGLVTLVREPSQDLILPIIVESSNSNVGKIIKDSDDEGVIKDGI